MIDTDRLQELLASTNLWAHDPEVVQISGMVTAAARTARITGTEDWTDEHWQAFRAGGLLMLALGLASVEET